MTDAPSPAVQAAQAAQERLNACLDENRSFRLEAGAGAGKTYSLVEALKKIIAERGPAMIRAGQKVACITYTEVARNEIAQDIEDHPAILVDTIHGFAWSFLAQHQKALRTLVADLESAREIEAITAAGGISNQIVEYNLGFFGVDENRVTLGHDHVPKFFAKLLANAKIRRLFNSLYPVLFIDEYQDTDPNVMSAISEHFFAAGEGPVTGLFGDHWQTIYRNDYALTHFPNVTGIDKGSNFRSVPAIVDVLNRLRPDLRQEVDDPAAEGEARFFHCNSFSGERQPNSPNVGELPEQDHASAIERMKDILAADGWDFSPNRTKILMLTHNAIAAKQGYQTIASIFDRKEAFVKKEDPVIADFIDRVEPVCAAYEMKQYGEMFALMGRTPTIRSHADKTRFAESMTRLLELRAGGTIGEVLDHLKATGQPRLSDRVLRREAEIQALGPEVTGDESNSLRRHRILRDAPYAELIEVRNFINGFTPFATQHSVKGAQFENVLVILSGGWNHYNWPRYLEQLQAASIPAAQLAGHYRTRNLFYVAISRPQTRLAVLATQKLSPTALSSASRLFGEEGVHALPFPA